MADESKSVGTTTEENDVDNDNGTFEDAVEHQENEEVDGRPETLKEKLSENVIPDTESTEKDEDSKEHVENGEDRSDIVVNGNGHENNLGNQEPNDEDELDVVDGQRDVNKDDEIEVVSEEEGDDEFEDEGEVNSEEEALEEVEDEAPMTGVAVPVQEEKGEVSAPREEEEEEEEAHAVDEDDDLEWDDSNEDRHFLKKMYMYEAPGGIMTMLESQDAHAAMHHNATCEGDDSDVDSADSEGMITFTTPTRSPEEDLPETVTKLETKDGSMVYLVGTAHFSEKSQDDVAKTIQAIQPDIVMVELCKSRVDMLMYDEAFLLKEVESMSVQKLRMCIRQNGVVGGLMHLLLLNLSAHISKQIGMAPGGEFRKAFHEHRKVPGCKFQLGDRPIQVTLNRVMGALSIWQKLYLGVHILTTQETITKEDIEKGKEKDFLAEMLAELVGDYPTLYEVFVSERDKYMAHTLRMAASPLYLHRHEETGVVYYCKAPKVVAVVGIGHVQGIKDNWEKEINIQELMTVPGPSRAGQVIKFFGKAAAIAMLSWGTYKFFQWTNIASFVGNYLPEKLSSFL